jgi:hypothetical protein
MHKLFVIALMVIQLLAFSESAFAGGGGGGPPPPPPPIDTPLPNGSSCGMTTAVQAQVDNCTSQNGFAEVGTAANGECTFIACTPSVPVPPPAGTNEVVLQSTNPLLCQTTPEYQAFQTNCMQTFGLPSVIGTAETVKSCVNSGQLVTCINVNQVRCSMSCAAPSPTPAPRPDPTCATVLNTRSESMYLPAPYDGGTCKSSNLFAQDIASCTSGNPFVTEEVGTPTNFAPVTCNFTCCKIPDTPPPPPPKGADPTCTAPLYTEVENFLGGTPGNAGQTYAGGYCASSAFVAQRAQNCNNQPGSQSVIEEIASVANTNQVSGTCNLTCCKITPNPTDPTSDFFNLDRTVIMDFIQQINPFSQGALKFLTGTGAMSDCPISSSITGMVVNCMEATIKEAVLTYGDVFYDAVTPFVIPMMILAIMLYGIEVALGDPEMKKKGFALVFRLGAVVYFGHDLGGNTGLIFAAMESMQDLVAEFVMKPNLSTALTIFSCPVGAALQYFTDISPSNYLWVRLDCILMDLFGIGIQIPGVADIGNPGGLAGSLFGILLGLLFTGSFGVICFGFGVTVLLSLMFFAVRVVYTFIVSYMLVGFLIIIAPLMVPFMLFPKWLGEMFDAWWKNILGAMMLPAMLFAFLSLVTGMLDIAIFNPLNPFALRNVASGKMMEESLRNDQPICQQGFLKNIPFYKNVPSSILPGTTANISGGNRYYTGPYGSTLTPTQSAMADLCSYIRVPKLDFPAAFQRVRGITPSDVAANPADVPTQTIFLMRLAICLFTTMLVAMLTLKMYDHFATISVGIFGGGGVLRSQVANAPMQKEVMAAANAVTSGFKNVAMDSKFNWSSMVAKRK